MVNSSLFGSDPCPLVTKTLSIRAKCVGGVTRSQLSTFSVLESGRLIWNGSRVVAKIDGIISIRPTAKYVEVQVTSGGYKFQSSGPAAGPY